MSTFPRTPRTQRGAIIGLDPLNPVASLVVFQYNPDTMTRTLTPQMAGEGGGDRTEALRLKGAPVENIRVDVEIDATDQLANGDVLASSMGIYPQLSALEMLVYPKTAQVILNTALMQVGTLEVVPPTAPLTLFIWGPKRVLPVKVSEFSITEEAYDPSLNPIRAKVALGLRVLSYNDLPLMHPGYALFLTHQVVKEAMAVVGSIAGLANAALPR
ncbi:hypothetical protein [Corallococcus sp. Z5C101001]|uniref:hypothetical protein n=1 Tax=Corallococcus sp. Z5C101001 TaxID=2596829 RepID=UPI00117C8962|nr:hypothetical protein [Corallococcus sp. Z5C101001]TSC32933.1 hypothetical protein FOF48_08035 [Corallococcus sp. Z5C101001]